MRSGRSNGFSRYTAKAVITTYRTNGFVILNLHAQG